MTQNGSIRNLENLVEFESTLRNYKIKSQIPVMVRFNGNNSQLIVEQDNFIFSAFISNQIIHQLSARIFPGFKNEFHHLNKKWKETLNKDKESLQQSISEAFRSNDLTISYHVKDSVNIVYGIVSDAFLPINQLVFRNLFLDAAAKMDSLDLNSKFIVNDFGNIIEQFDFKSGDGRIKLSYLLNYARNNGYHAIKVMWGRIVIVCSNGLTRIEDGDHLKYRHLKTESIQEFVNASLLEGIQQKMATEERIDRALNEPLKRTLFDEFMNRLHLSTASKERVISQLKIEINETGKNEWALSQALTWLGTHEKHLMARPKRLLTEAGSSVLDHSLKGFLEMDSNTSGDDKAYGAILPNDFLLKQ